MSEHLSGSIPAASAFSSTASFGSAGVSACHFVAFSPGLGRAFKILHLQDAFWDVLMHNRAISSVCFLLSSRLMPPSTILCCVKLCSSTSFLNFELFYEGFSCGSGWFSRYPNRQNKSLEWASSSRWWPSVALFKVFCSSAKLKDQVAEPLSGFP